jgi:hypothetical protein
MILLQRQPSDDLQELMQMASAITGFSLNAIEELLDSELETPHLLEYVTAVITKRMN